MLISHLRRWQVIVKLSKRLTMRHDKLRQKKIVALEETNNRLHHNDIEGQ